MHSQEESYILSDSDHMVRSNRYVFNYSEHWRRTNGKALTISIRSVKQILSTRALWFEGLFLSDNSNIMPISLDISLSKSWVKLNKALNDYRIEQYEIYKQRNPNTNFTSGDYVIAYEEAESRFNILVNSYNNPNFHIKIEKIEDDKTKENKNVSKDLLAMSGYKSSLSELINDLIDLSDGKSTIEQFNLKHINDPIEVELNSNNQIKRISFTNIWNRDILAIHASFVDLSYHQWLGVCNEQFIPPKEYPIVFDDHKFWIELFTLDGRPVELPADNKDQIIIEAMMNSYI